MKNNKWKIINNNENEIIMKRIKIIMAAWK